MADGPRAKAAKRMNAYQARKLFEYVDAALYEGADKVRAAAHRSISAGSSSAKGRQPSAPGEPPNRDSGVLQANLEVETLPPTKSLLRARVTSGARYSAALEFGTSKMAARPFLRPARDKVAPEAKKIMIRKIRAALKVI